MDKLDLSSMMNLLGESGNFSEMLDQQSKLLEMITGQSTSSASASSKPVMFGTGTKGDGKEKSKTKFTRLEKQIGLSADSRSYMKEQKYDEAYGLLSSLVNLGEEGCFVPVLINYYKVLISSGRIEESVDVKDKLTVLVKEKLLSTPVECERLADKYRLKNEHIKAFLFYQIGGALFTSNVETGNIVNYLQGCILGIKISTGKLMKQRPDLRYIVTPHVIPAMRVLYEKLRTMKASQPKVMNLILALCLHHIETTELSAEDPTHREATLREAAALLEERFGDDAKKHHLYSATLNNLGVTLYSMHKPHEAMEVLNRAMKARQAAEDYDTPAEKDRDVKMTAGAISKVEEMILFMQE